MWLTFIWLLFTKARSILVAWMKAYLLKEKSFWSVKIPADTTWSWRKILKLRTCTRPLVKHILGKGDTVFSGMILGSPKDLLLKYMGRKLCRMQLFPLKQNFLT
ncbi:hypothetical protein SLEP1_g16744 [Rubroshorea leprosula]|uniref:Secreted protein n=1 Tax=Rubroshorea leprosula TaxID=152421 RepID=A0AAV5IXT3_9ROSI|nr:hypothetical protein SLEP1_g16744 [Rubroshorea leprosula]